MRNFSLLLLLLACTTVIQGQVIKIIPGTPFLITSGTSFSADGLLLSPSTDFDLNGATLMRTTQSNQPPSNNYISRVFQFANTTVPFSGSILFRYEDSETNSLNEYGFKVNVYDGTTWKVINSNTNNVVENYVLSEVFSNYTLSEITLTDMSVVLPLQWVNVRAYRVLNDVKIDWETKQEINVSFFNIERSLDGRRWNTVVENIPASNTNLINHYSAFDHQYTASKIYYRIKQTGRDGQLKYSPVAIVPAQLEAGQMVVYPNPFQSEFYINNQPLNQVSQLQLYNNSGSLLKTWNTPSFKYSIHNLPPGIYHLHIQLKNGKTEVLKLNKQ